MTDIAFHSGVADKLGYACRLLRKACRSEARVVVSGPPDLLSRLDRQLWVFDDLEFIPHVHLRGGASDAPGLARAPIVLADEPAQAPHREVLLHLGLEPSRHCGLFSRVIEVVSSDAADREAGQRRWREYKALGHTLTHHVAGTA